VIGIIGLKGFSKKCSEDNKIDWLFRSLVNGIARNYEIQILFFLDYSKKCECSGNERRNCRNKNDKL
jgi:hypothetical protein